MEKPDALRLADWLDDQYDPTHNQESAAAELRRLHATLQAREEEIETHSAAVYEATKLLSDARAQRDALLEALNAMLTHMGMDEDKWNKPTFDQARAAIAAVEGEKK